MTKPKPHIIIEGNTPYCIGELQGKEVIYDFDKILAYLNIKGKLLFGDRFKLFDEDREILFCALTSGC